MLIVHNFYPFHLKFIDKAINHRLNPSMAEALRTKVLSTRELPEREQFDYWREIICETFTDLSPQRSVDGSFMGSVSTHEQAGLVITEITSEAQTVKRGKREISCSPFDYFFLLLQQKGSGQIRQDGREIVLEAGEYALIDATRPYQLSFADDFQQVCMNIPRRGMLSRFFDPRSVTAIKPTVSSQLFQLGLNYIQTLRTQQVVDNPINENHLTQNFLELLSIIFNEQSNKQNLQKNSISHSTKLDLLHCFIKSNIALPDLNAKMAANHLGFSVRYIHKLLNNTQTTFGRTVLDLRLEKCADLLSNPNQNNKSIAEIAYQVGFNDLSHFGRSFKKRYNTTPREWRKKN